MENLLRDRIRERLAALDLNPFEAARLIPAERTFLNDLLIGKKKTIRANAIPAVAAALQCDAGYLMGTQPRPRGGISPETPEKSPLARVAGLPLVGIAEAGTWRLSARSGQRQTLPVSPDPRYPAERQVAFLVRGDHAAELGAGDGSVILALTGADCREGDVVLIRRTREGPEGQEEEITLRRFDGATSGPRFDQERVKATRDAGAESPEILARGISSHKVF